MKYILKSGLAFLLVVVLLFSTMPIVSFALTSASTIEYETKNDTNITFDEDDFYDVCDDATGEDLSYVKFSPPSSSYGTLYYYSSFGSTTKREVTSSIKCYYDDSTNDLDRVFFSPDEDNDGTINITYTGYNEDDEAICTGRVRITIEDSSKDVENIEYEVSAGDDVTFDDEDFYDVVDDATSEDLYYVTFTIPDSDYGKLYYYSSSTSTTRRELTSSIKCYYNGATNSLSRVVFVADEDYDGTFDISYKAYNDDADEICTGEIEITVEETDSDNNAIKYQVAEDDELSFDEDDFNDVCEDETGESLDYIKFTIPSTTYGSLYYDDKRITSSSTKYYYDSAPLISDITFVPDDDYAGPFSITYTGYNEDGDTFTGTIRITVGDEDSAAKAGDIMYTVDGGSKIKFDAYKFDYVCDNATDETLNYVKFTLPSSSMGTLYYDYTSSLSIGTAVVADTKYYYDSTPAISRITFVPNLNYSGTFSIIYTGYNVEGRKFTGNIKFTVKAVNLTSGSKYFKDVGSEISWAATYIDNLYEKGVVSGIGASGYGPNLNISRGDFMLMIFRAFNLTVADTGGSFSDVNKSMYYYNAIATAKSLGIAQGSDGKFNPNEPITRQDAMVLLKRTLDKLGKTLTTTDTTSSLSSYSDYRVIKDYAIDAISVFVRAKIIKGDNNNINPTYNMTRAEMAVLLYRVLNN